MSMLSLIRKSHRAVKTTRSRKLSIESLEQKKMLDGNVHVAFIDTSLSQNFSDVAVVAITPPNGGSGHTFVGKAKVYNHDTFAYLQTLNIDIHENGNGELWGFASGTMIPLAHVDWEVTVEDITANLTAKALAEISTHGHMIHLSENSSLRTTDLPNSSALIATFTIEPADTTNPSTFTSSMAALGVNSTQISYNSVSSQFEVRASLESTFVSGVLSVVDYQGQGPNIVINPANSYGVRSERSLPLDPLSAPVKPILFDVGEPIGVGNLGTGAVDLESLLNTSSTLTFHHDITLGGVIDNHGTISIDSGVTVTLAGSIIMEDGSSIAGSGTLVNNGVLAYNGSSAQSITTAITGTGVLSKGGSGNLTVSVANTHTGGTELYDGTLTVANDSALGSSTADPGVKVNGGTLNLNGHVVTVNDLALLGGKIDLTTGGIIVPVENFSFKPYSTSQTNERGTVGVVESGNDALHDALQEGGNYLDLNITSYWDGGHGITSSSAAASFNDSLMMVVGYVLNDYTQYSSWRGKSVDTSVSNQALISYTYLGDADLDGIVNAGIDYDLWYNTVTNNSHGTIGSVTGSSPELIDGDFDANGVVDIDDFSCWASTASQSPVSLGFNVYYN
jgi:autotransporter-associated beta strand protein